MLYNDNFDRTKKYAKAFWEKELIDRPYVCVTAPKNNANFPTEGTFHSPQTSYTACVNENYDSILQTHEKIVANTYYAGEALPTFEVTLGPDEYAGFLGAKINAKEGFYTTWAEPCVEDWDSFAVYIDKSEGSYYNKVKKYLEYAAVFSRDKFFLNMLDLHSNIDAMSALRGPEDLCFDIMDNPDSVHTILEQIDNTYDDIYNMAYKAGQMDQRGTIGWSPIYCEGRSAVVQCDFSCMLSPTQAREFVIPSITREAAYLDHSIYHYDGKEALGHLDDVLAIQEIDCIQWVPGEGQPRTLEWMPLLKKIQSAGKSIWIYDWTAEEIKANFKELELNKVAFSLNVGTQDEADELLEFLTKNT